MPSASSRRWFLAFALALTGLVSACATPSVPATPAPDASPTAWVERIELTVSDLDRSLAFFTEALEFEVRSEPRAGADRREVELALGEARIVLVEPDRVGRPVPADSRSNDLWFQHLALVVSDMDAAHARLVARGVRGISTGGPQTIPLSNPAAGGIRAWYFLDPDDHPLELIWYPPGKGRPEWQSDTSLFLGIDHTAIAVADTDRSRAVYEGVLGFRKAGDSFNHGPEQAALSGVDGAEVEITGLFGARGVGVEFLRYRAPGPGRPYPADSEASDQWSWRIVVGVPLADEVDERARAAGATVTQSATGFELRDPDGHRVAIEEGRP